MTGMGQKKSHTIILAMVRRVPLGNHLQRPAVDCPRGLKDRGIGEDNRRHFDRRSAVREVGGWM